MKQSKSMRVSWPPADLQSFCAHLTTRKSVHTARNTVDFSPSSWQNYNGRSNLEAGQGVKSLHHLSVAEGREFGPILEDNKVHTIHTLEVRPSNSLTTCVSDQQVAEYEVTVGAVGSVSDRSDDEPFSSLVNDIGDAEGNPDDHLRGWRLALVIVALMLGQFMTSFDGYVISRCWSSYIWVDLHT